ncbi:hypothetical protein UNDYM_2334 [Undibacterium sp. YM2]|nr:hypothetical protein UNDYM_2334 [Undibacterium sp. YM2]
MIYWLKRYSKFRRFSLYSLWCTLKFQSQNSRWGVAANALAEISVLEDIHNVYKEKCRAFVKKFDIFEDYENLHQVYWLS